MYSVEKSYRDLPAAHRQPRHDGHCSLIHGHNWGFDISFKCSVLDACGFVIDVGKLGFVKKFLEETFDHTLLLNEDDPALPILKGLQPQLAKIVLVPNCGMEGLAQLVYDRINQAIQKMPELTDRWVSVFQVVVWEDGKNCATCSFQ